MQLVGLIQDLLRLYEAEPAFVGELRQTYARNWHLLSLAKCLASAYQDDFNAWYEDQAVSLRRPPTPYGLGRFPQIESWSALRELARQSTRPPVHLTAYLAAIETMAARWFVGAPWGAEVIHACLVTWRSVPAWRNNRLSVGGGQSAGFPSMWLQVKVQFEPGAHTWGEVRQWVLRDAKGQFDEITRQLRMRKQRTGRSELLLRRRSRRRLAIDESTYDRNLRWLFMTLAPDAVLKRPLTPHEVFDRDLVTEDPNLSTVEKAVSDLRRELDLS